MSGPSRVALIGAGAIAQAYLQAMRQLPDARIVGVADLRPAAARAAAEDAGCPAFESHQDLLDAVAVDAAILCTPPCTHAEIALFLLQRGTPVLCEKPLSIDAETAANLLQVAAEKQVVFTMASKFRYAEDVVRARSLITSGVLGEIILFENAFASRVDMRSRWNSDPEVSGGGVLIDNGTHSVDLFRYLVGPVAEVQAVEGKRVQKLAVEDTVQIFARSESGVMATIDLSWSLNKELDSYINIYGSQGTIRVGWKASRYQQTSGTDWVTFGDGYDKIACFRSQLQNFLGAVRGEESLRIQPEDALASVQVIEAAYQSLRTNNWIRVLK